ncbi:SAM-dependent methyltransferase [Kineosporia succinea]|uniref:SAM-dependent methyltransferase n=1 Tax=Kineosporia succinea TaxID=84632 RepID=A0ABT9PG50_9ACTN|nr:class I SAM-dependent methyltransferase [Kineosporia succinea]MDP9831120.1 SAM-dependent methyltransferase [Kineosporia succinea]
MTEQQPALIQALGARGVVREWARGAQTLAVVEAAHRLGWLEALREPVTVDALVGPGWSANRVRVVTDVLAEAGVITRTEAGLQLTPPFAALLSGPSGVGLDVVLASVRQDLQALATLDRDAPRPVDGEAALVVARDAGVRADPVTQALYRSVYDALPEVAELLRGGGPMLDLGSGVGGALLTTAQLYPKLKLVGVEIVPEVAAEAERRRDDLGLADRVEIRCADARDLADDNAFRVAYWAQCFFPDDTREGTLAALRRVLTDDGLLILQEQLSTPYDAVQLAQRGISAGHTTSELAREAEKAGFRLVREVATHLGNLTLVRNQS